jgi:c-di-GMP-binding flagellar brake protein YcgR
MEATVTHTPRALTDGRESVKKAEMRDQARLSASGIVTVVWRDEKRQIRYMRSLLRNMSGGGALVLAFRPLPVGSSVRIRDANLFLISGTARVRHCTRCGFAYLIGMKFDSDIAARF